MFHPKKDTCMMSVYIIFLRVHSTLERAASARQGAGMNINGAMYDPHTYDGIRKPATEATTLPPFCYTSEEFFRAEVRHMFMKVWNFLGRADRIPKVGDYFAIDFVGVPLIVLRDRDGTVKAFANSCRHRGTRLIDGEMVDTVDNCRGIKCPYHS